MHNSLTRFVPCLAGMLLLGLASAQDTKPATPSSKSTPSTSSQSKTSAAKKPASSSTASKTAAPVALTTQKQKQSYALGMSIGLGFQKQGIDKSIDSSLVVRGFRDSIAGSKTAMTEDEMKAALQQLRTEVMSAQEAKAKEAGSAHRKEGETFLAANKSKDGVKALADGLQYKVLTEGNGPKPAATDTVTVNYRGTLINGKEFDSSYKRGQPASFPVSGVIKGWTEALQLMPVGSKWQLFIPADLAYGDRGAGADIAPGDTLIFEVELLSIGEQKK
ncbi:MAG TPA: FKBP-type peptidyl-prolyl cis-trans isomerase [Candidatus Sulfotelmatobacter sp.]|nr:FKBP-type peptidyl-prolyl cis-trans isomerase [Candidatus Sulfotelmatobacter sp.]